MAGSSRLLYINKRGALFRAYKSKRLVCRKEGISFCDGDGKMDLISVPETGKNAADIVFTYAKKQGRKVRALTGNYRKKGKILSRHCNRFHVFAL